MEDGIHLTRGTLEPLDIYLIYQDISWHIPLHRGTCPLCEGSAEKTLGESMFCKLGKCSFHQHSPSSTSLSPTTVCSWILGRSGQSLNGPWLLAWSNCRVSWDLSISTGASLGVIVLWTHLLPSSLKSLTNPKPSNILSACSPCIPSRFHHEPEKPFVVEVNTSDVCARTLLSHWEADGKLHTCFGFLSPCWSLNQSLLQLPLPD